MSRIVDALPWPAGLKPSLAFAVHPVLGFVVLLHEPVCRGWADVARIAGPTPEGALRLALGRWCEIKGLGTATEFVAALRHLVN